ncbi:MAG: ATP-binding protein [Spirochaetota bacterium]
MYSRSIAPTLARRLADAPAVVLLGPRQAGKTTLALMEAERHDSIYIDLESPRDRAKLADPELYLERHFGKLVVLDEIHRYPDLFPAIRGLIDRARRQEHRAGLYLLLGSASLDLLRQSGETLAGRVSYLELSPFTVLEAVPEAAPEETLWLRGGFPQSVLAGTDEQSFRWREDFVRTYLEREIPRFGSRVAAETLRRLWTMLAHLQGTPVNVAQLARNTGLDGRTVAAYIDLLVDLLLLRRLPPLATNVGKRLTKSPKLFVRDSGLVHTLLGIHDRDQLLSHPVVGQSWEGFVVENILVACGDSASGYYYRTSGGAEIDLLLEWRNGDVWAIEVKRSLDPRPGRGFHSAIADIRPARQFVVYPGEERYPVTTALEAVSLRDLAVLVAEQRGPDVPAG